MDTALLASRHLRPASSLCHSPPSPSEVDAPTSVSCWARPGGGHLVPWLRREPEASLAADTDGPVTRRQHGALHLCLHAVGDKTKQTSCGPRSCRAVASGGKGAPGTPPVRKPGPSLEKRGSAPGGDAAAAKPPLRSSHTLPACLPGRPDAGQACLRFVQPSQVAGSQAGAGLWVSGPAGRRLPSSCWSWRIAHGWCDAETFPPLPARASR